MNITEALQKSDNVVCQLSNVSVLVSRCSSEPFQEEEQYSYLHTMRHVSDTSKMQHGFIYGSLSDLFNDIHERDDDMWIEDDAVIELADWQTTTQRVDLSTCRCRDCYDWLKSYGVIAEGVTYEQWSKLEEAIND